MPRLTAATPAASSEKFGNRPSGASTTGWPATAGSCGRAARRRRRPRSRATPCRAGPTCTTCRGTSRRPPRTSTAGTCRRRSACRRGSTGSAACRSPLPPPVDRDRVDGDDAAAVRGEHAAGDDGGSPKISLAVGRQEQRLRRRRRGDHRAPARRAVGAATVSIAASIVSGVGLRGRRSGRQRHPHQAGVDERRDRRRRQPPLRSASSALPRSATPRRATRSLGGRHREVSRPFGRHRAARSAAFWASLQLEPCCTSTSWGRPSTRSATMLRCTSPVPPPIVSAWENR